MATFARKKSSLGRMSGVFSGNRLFALALVIMLGTGVTLYVRAQTSDDVTSAAYALKHKSAESVAKVLAPLLEDDQRVLLKVDRKENQLLVKGPAWAHESARQVIESLDRPQPRRNEPESGRVVAYFCSSEQLAGLETRVQDAFPNTRVAISQLSDDGRVFVRAPSAVHERLATWLRSTSNESAPRKPAVAKEVLPQPESKRTVVPRQLPVANAETNDAGSVSANERRFVPVPAGSIARIRRELIQMFGARIRGTDESPNQLQITTPTGTLRVELDPYREDILVDGPKDTVDQFSRLVGALSRSGPTKSGDRQQVLILQRDVQPRLKELLTPPSNSKLNDRQSRRQPANKMGVQPVAYQAPIANDTAAPDPSNQNPAQDKENPPRFQQFEGIEIEMLPDLDAIILKGREQELQQLSEIIQQLEQISRQTKPVIEVVPLHHVNSQRVAAILQQTQTNLIGSRQGRATVTALGKPNAMLIIGWGEAVTAFIELIAKLDRPVAPDSQFDVFHLKHASATAVQTSLQTFFASRQGLEPVIQSMVDARSNSIVVHAAPRDLAEVRRLIERLDVPQGAAVHRARVFPIQHSLAADVAQTLQQAIQTSATGGRNAAMELYSENGEPLAQSGILENTQITVNARNNSVIVSGPADNLKLIEELIRQLDTPGMVAKIKIFPIAHSDASSLVDTLRSLLPSQTGANQGPQLSRAQGQTTLTGLRFTLDARSNSIIATGSDGDLKIVEALIVRLDENDAMQRKTTIYQLKNSPAVDVALAINEFLRNNRQVETVGVGTVNPFQQLEKEVVVVPEPVANKLILSATPRYFEEISELIEKLDQQPPQVMIQVLIAEVTLGNAEEFGVEFGLQDSVLFDRSLLGNLITTTNSTQTSTPAGILTQTQQSVIAASNTPGFDFNNTNPLGNSGSARALGTAGAVAGQGLSNFAVGRGNTELGFGGLVLSASSQNVSALLRALHETRRLEVLSRPQVLTLDNQPAFIQVGQRVPRIVGSNINQAGQQNNVALENVGLILGVTPRISPEGNVVMEIDAEKSDLGPEAEGIPVSVSANGTVIRSPRINTTTAQATVSAASGETIILGGLITKSMRELHRKVPFLGDLPVLKYLFRFDSYTEKRTELLIILTPTVVKSQGDVDRLKSIEAARMSWCVADVLEIHGDIGVGNPLASPMPDGECEVVYPDVDPRGQSATKGRSSSPLEPVPAQPLPRATTIPSSPMPPPPPDTSRARRDGPVLQGPLTRDPISRDSMTRESVEPQTVDNAVFRESFRR